jgi:ribosomal-protein-alanine N-acetyltransferase
MNGKDQAITLKQNKLMMQPVFIPFPELKTDRLLLRRIIHDDAPEIFFFRSNENILQFIGKEPATTLKDAQDYIHMIDDGIEKNETIMWGIVLKENPSKLIGTICYWRLQKENYRAEIGYLLHPDHWRKGIMKEAILEIIEYGFHSMKLHSIEARIHTDNTASAAILEATGFIKEGFLKEEFFSRGKFLDTIIYSRLQ